MSRTSKCFSKIDIYDCMDDLFVAQLTFANSLDPNLAWRCFVRPDLDPIIPERIDFEKKSAQNSIVPNIKQTLDFN